MRRLVWLGILFAALWSGWWYFAASSLQAGLDMWLEDRRAEGWQADVGDLRVSGFPAALETSLWDPVLADPDTGLALAASELRFSAPVWWPGYVTLFLPDDAITIASPDIRRQVQAEAARADLRLLPGQSLEVQQMALTSGVWTVSVPQGSVMGAMGLTLEMLQDEEDASRYHFTLDAPAFEPGSVPRDALLIPEDWPVAFDSLTLKAAVTFDRPVDRRTIEAARPQPRRIDLPLAEAHWGALLLRGAASLDVAPGGVLNGTVSLQARNWREMVALAETAGALPAGLRPQLENVLAALARGSGNPDTIDVKLSIRDGMIYMGFLPLGPAPLVILR